MRLIDLKQHTKLQANWALKDALHNLWLLNLIVGEDKVALSIRRILNETY